MLHVRREAASHEHARVELLGGRMLLSLVEAGLQILQALRALRNHLIVHGVLPCLGGASASRRHWGGITTVRRDRTVQRLASARRTTWARGSGPFVRRGRPLERPTSRPCPRRT